MKRIYIALISVCLGISTNLSAQAPSWQWAKSIGGTGYETAEGVATDLSGNVFVTGSFEGTVDFDPGPGTFNLTSAGIVDIFLLKLDSLGDFQWAISMGGQGSDRGYALVIDPAGNVYVTGRFNNTVDFDPDTSVVNLVTNGNFDIFVAKYNTNGQLDWAKGYGGQTDDHGFTIALDAGSNIIVGGYFQFTCDFDPGPNTYVLVSVGGYDGYIMKLEPTGDLLWARSFGGNLFDVALGVSTDAAGNVYSTGHYNGNVDFDPGTGVYPLPSFGGDDIFVSKLDPNGLFVYAKALGGVQNEWGTEIVTDPSGNAFSTGMFRGTADFDPGNQFYNLNVFTGSSWEDVYTSKLNPAGDFAWAFATGGAQTDNGYGIALDSDLNVYTSGFFRQQVDFNPGTGVNTLTSIGDNDGFITKTDSARNYLWTKTWGGVHAETPYSVSIDPFDHAVVTGSYLSAYMVMDGDTLFNNQLTVGSSGDIFIARLHSAFFSGVNENPLKGNVSVYPNPADGEIHVQLPAGISGTVKTELMDVSGRVVFASELHQSNHMVIDSEQFSGGIYFLRISANGYNTVEKVVLK